MGGGGLGPLLLSTFSEHACLTLVKNIRFGFFLPFYNFYIY
jgi:hypothetical protein